MEGSAATPQFTVNLQDEAGLARIGLAVENSETRRCGALERVNDERRLAVFAKCTDPLPVTVNDALGGLCCGFRCQVGKVAPQFGCSLVGAHCDHDGIRGKAIERTL